MRSDEVVLDLVVFAAIQQDREGPGNRPAGAADLLVVGDERSRPLVVSDLWEWDGRSWSKSAAL